MSSAPGTDLREFARIEQVLRVRFQFVEGPGKDKKFGWMESHSRNLSEKGVFIELGPKTPFPDDAIGNFVLFRSILGLEITIPEIGTFAMKGKPVWIEKKIPGQEKNYRRGVAIEFTEISPDHAARLRDFLYNSLKNRDRK